MARLPRDGFDDWAQVRDKRLDNSVSARYVSPGVIGYQDLDAYGVWQTSPVYGSVWVPFGPRDGRPTATVTGRGSNLGDGLGSMMLPGDLRLSTMDAGSTGTADGAGLPDRSGTGTPTTLRPWWAGSEDPASVSASDSGRLGASVLALAGSRWAGVNRSILAIVDGDAAVGVRGRRMARRIREQRLSAQRQRHQYAHYQHQQRYQQLSQQQSCRERTTPSATRLAR